MPLFMDRHEPPPGGVFITRDDVFNSHGLDCRSGTSTTCASCAPCKGHAWDDVGEHSFKGFDEPVRIYRLRWSA